MAGLGAKSTEGSLSVSEAQWRDIIKEAIIAYACVGTWIIISGIVIIYNKWLLSYYGFHFPILMTMWHMLFCSIAAQILINNFHVTPKININTEDFRKRILPIAALFAGTLSFSNSAYLTLSVAFIQMIKATMPATVYMASILCQVDTFSWKKVAIMTIVCVGTAIASYGEINFVLTGFIFQVCSLGTESTRIVLVQVLLQRQGLKLNPLTTLYYVAPACFVFLCVPFAFFELPELLTRELILNPAEWMSSIFGGFSHPLIFLSNAFLALLLNLAVLLTIGRLSALTLNIGGVVKDVLLILVSAALFSAPISSIQVIGYSIAVVGVSFYNYLKFMERLEKKTSQLETKPLLESDPESAGDSNKP